MIPKRSASVTRIFTLRGMQAVAALYSTRRMMKDAWPVTTLHMRTLIASGAGFRWRSLSPIRRSPLHDAE